MNWGHKWARIYRRVRSEAMPVRGATAHFDRERNILFINADHWADLSPQQQATVMRTEETIISSNQAA